MRIANPIYDVVFKYLMEDNPSAKLILSVILGEEITELVLCPQEQTFQLGTGALTVYRLDFAATVKNVAGEPRQVLIEIQKAKLPGDIMRFRRYLGNQYRNKQNIGAGPDGKNQPLPLLTVYFLGYPLDHTTAPVIHVRRDSTDLTTGEKLAKKEHFIESLTHDSYVIQIACLRPVQQTEVEQLLQVFDQSKVHGDRHLLEIDEEAVPARYRQIVRRLFQAAAEPELADAMDAEDDILEELQEMEREFQGMQRELRNMGDELRGKEGEIREKEGEIREKEGEIREKEGELQKKERELQEKEKAVARADARAEQERAEKERLLARLKQAGIEP